MPTEENVNEPGLALAAAMRSPTVLETLRGRNNEYVRRDAKWNNGGEVVSGVVAQLGIEGRGDRVGGTAGEDCVTVGIRPGHRGGPDRSTSAGAVFDHDGLPELLRELLEHNSRDNVGGAACRERHNRSHRLCRPGLGRVAGCNERQAEDSGLYQAEAPHGSPPFNTGDYRPRLSLSSNILSV